MMSNRYLSLLLLILLAPAVYAQQVADTLFNPVIVHPAYAWQTGPTVLIDEAHNNFHTMQGRFRAFANVVGKDGYVVKPAASRFTRRELNECKILVIANALHHSNTQAWTLPTPSAFTDEEVAAVNTWVNDGGSLFLIADHMPFPGAAENLARSFGFTFNNGFAMKNGGKDIFTEGNGLIKSLLTEGRDENERVTSLQTFTGQAFAIPPAAQPVIVLGKKYELKIPKTAWEFKKDTEIRAAENLIQGAYMQYGKGRIVVFGEAAMFTAQLQGKNEVGMNQKSASQNVQFLLNTIHWLDGLLK